LNLVEAHLGDLDGERNVVVAYFLAEGIHPGEPLVVRVQRSVDALHCPVRLGLAKHLIFEHHDAAHNVDAAPMALVHQLLEIHPRGVGLNLLG